ncbi:MAG: hypothetical protein GIW99_11585 [Candidatus Eremiobacteraeota bacterium]|nr:hypothetical protein [Candidatus Eremiobacteraeota bacterium]MBC5828302.1 hypothetical protein [Candidatus Eremiobacteraeota bacterium]
MEARRGGRSRIALMCGLAAWFFLSSAARADSPLPVSVGLGAFLPTSKSSAFNGSLPVGGTVSQSAGFGLFIEVAPPVSLGGYQLGAALLESRQRVSLPPGAFQPLGTATSQDITQIPITLEQAGGMGPIRLGGGLGYDFVSAQRSGTNGQANGIVADAFGRFDLSGGAGAEIKVYFGRQAALGGILIGLTKKL